MIGRFLSGQMFFKAVIAALLVAVGYGWGNLHATDRLLREREELGARTQAKNHEGIILWYRDKMKEIRIDQEKQKAADVSAYAILQDGKATSDANLRIARAALARAMEAPNVVISPPVPFKAVPSDPGCVLNPGVRQSLNAAIDSLNYRPDVGYSEAPPARLPDGTSAAVAPVTCGELVGSLTDILEHDAMLTAWVLSWQRWAYEALR